MSYLLDTNVISETIHGKPNRAVISWLDQIPGEALFVDVPTLGEVNRHCHQRSFSIQPWMRRISAMLCAEAGTLTRMREWSGVAAANYASKPSPLIKIVGVPDSNSPSVLTGIATILPEDVATRISRPSALHEITLIAPSFVICHVDE